MSKIPVKFLSVRGSMVAGDTAAFVEEVVVKLEAEGAVRRLSLDEIALARGDKSNGESGDQVTDLQTRLSVAANEMRTLKTAKTKATNQAEAMRVERDAAVAERDQARREATTALAALETATAPEIEVVEADEEELDAASIDPDVDAPTETTAETETGAPPEQGATE